MLYFDHAATTPVHPEVIKLLASSYAEDFANPASQHRLGKEMANDITEARMKVLELLDADPSQYDVIFTSSATESNNQVLKTYLYNHDDAILHYLSDHPSVTNCMKTSGVHILDSQDICEEITENTELVVISHVNSQSGQIRDVEKLSKKCKELKSDVRVLVDSAQGVGKVPITLKDSQIDYLVMAAHKFGGPRGIAALVFKKDAKLNPLINGGGHELNVRASTPSTPLIKGIVKALEISTSDIEAKYDHSQKQSQKLRDSLCQMHKNISFPFAETEDDCSPFINTMIFKGLPSDVLLRSLEEKNVFVSSSTACSSKVKVKNKMLIGLGIKESEQRNVLRISLSQKTTDQEVEEFISIFNDCIQSLSFLIK